MIGGKRGVRIIEKTIKIADIEPEVCEMELGGFFDKDDTCVVKLKFDEDKPHEVDLIEIKRRSV